jgi:hypothetical protein
MSKHYSISEDGKWLWMPVKEVPWMGIQDGDYREISGQSYKYQKRIANTWFNRHREYIVSNLEYTAFILGTFGVGALPIILGILFHWPEFLSYFISIAITAFQLYFFQHLKKSFSNK